LNQLLSKEYMIDVSNSSSAKKLTYNPVSHVTALTFYSGLYSIRTTSTSSLYYFLNNFCDAKFVMDSILPLIIESVRTSVVFPLEFQQDDNFELLNFVSELDDTLKVFSGKFWNSLSYGSVNWGLLPLYSDLKSLYNTLGTLFSKTKSFDDQLGNFSSVVNRRFAPVDIDTTDPTTGLRYKGRVTIRARGSISMDLPLDKYRNLKILLDELGVHPDLKTIWDLIPLSFLADYYIPIGDVLEGLHPRGWYNPQVDFSGYFTIKGTIAVQPRLTSQGVPGSLHTISEFDYPTYNIYTRRRISFSTVTRKPVVVNWGAPDLSFRKIFNSLYVLNKKKKPKRI